MFENHEKLSAHCNRHGLNVNHARRVMRKSDDGIPNVDTIAGMYFIDKNAPPITLPELGKHAAKRADGRERYTVWATETEHTDIVDVVGAANVVNPRVVAKQRRDARKRAAETNDDDDAS